VARQFFLGFSLELLFWQLPGFVQTGCTFEVLTLVARPPQI
jgi:hypothetical protein